MISYIKIYDYIKEIAWSNHWQSLYAHVKEIGSFDLFNNRNEPTALQLQLLNEIAFYSSICLDVSLGDVSELVLKDPIYCDAWFYYKNKERGKQKKKTTALPTTKMDKRQEVVNQNQWVFTKVKGK